MLRTVFILSLFINHLIAQENLVLNGSLETWENGIPKYWKIEANSVDIFKSNYRVIPKGESNSDMKFRNKFPQYGNEGVSYIGVYYDEVISCTLARPLSKDSIYKMTIHVRNPPIYQDKSVDTFTVKIVNQKGEQQIIKLNTFEVVDTTMHSWSKVESIFSGVESKDKLFLGYFGESYDSLEFGAVGLYYLFDDLSIQKGIIKTDTLNIFFPQGKHSLNPSQVGQLKSKLNIEGIQSISINGYASHIGSEESNLELSDLRVKDVLKLIPRSSKLEISTQYFGESKSKIGDEENDRKTMVIFKYLVFE
ncbi:MAG: hypothetical protein AAGK97_08725 [Bacteroidota bacterium]